MASGMFKSGDDLEDTATTPNWAGVKHQTEMNA